MVCFVFFILFQLRYRHAQHATIDKKPGNYILINTATHTGCQACWDEMQIIVKNKISVYEFSVYKTINMLFFFPFYVIRETRFF